MEKFQYLIAPVTLDALCIGSTTSDDILAKSFTPSHGEFQGLAGFSETNRPFLSDAYVRRPFSYESPYYLGAGVHLHWDLPRALKTGVQAAGPENAEDESCDLEYPPVPNRWLVTRIWTAAAKSDTPKTRICHWIVESDYLASAKEEPATDLPWFKDDDGKGDLFRYMGRAIKLADSPSWAEDPAASRFDPLTALGYGEPAFTAYYPDCRTVFGFHDRNLEAEGFNHEQDTLSYAVMGWYSDKGADPVALAVQDDRLPDLLTQFHWYLPEGDPGGAAGLICRGFTYDVDWHKDATLLPNQFDPNDVTVAVGNTASEGLATLLKNRKSPGTDGGEKLLHALQDGHMEALDRLDALAELEKLLHKDTFGTQSGGLLWKIQAVQSGAGTVTRQKVPAEFIESLNQLNSEQAKLNRTQENIETVRRQLYADWCKFMLCKYDRDRDGIKEQLSEWGIDTNGILKFVSAAIEDDTKGGSPPNPNTLTALEAEAATLESTIRQWTGDNGLFKDLPQEFSLEQGEETAYHFPNEPVFTVSSKALTPSSRPYGEKRIVFRQDLLEITDHADQMWQALIKAGCIDDSGLILSHLIPLESPEQISLPEPFDLHQDKVFTLFQRVVKGSVTCRRDTQLISSVDIQDAQGQVAVTRDQLPGLAAMPDVPACAGSLLAELFFYLPCHAPHEIAEAAAGGDLKRYGELRQKIESLMATPDTYYTDCLKGGALPQAVAANQWKWPWHPQFLHWKIGYWPLKKVESTITKEDEETRTTFTPDLITANFDFSDDHMELGQTRAQFADMDPPEYMGITVLTPGAVQNLKDRTCAFLESHSIDWVADLTRDLENTAVLSQTLSGYNESLLTFDSRLKFPIADPPERLSRYCDFTKSVGDTVKSHYSASPVPNANFNPIRAGYMRVTGIRVVDTFGQHREIENPPFAVASSFTPQKPLETDYGKIYLPPRVVPPARLTAYFIPERTPEAGATCHPENPVLGWIVPNFLDRGIMIFDVEGTALGTVKVSDGACVLRPAPGKDMPAPEKIVEGIENTFFQGMVRSLLGKNAAELDAFIDLMERGLHATYPESEAETPLLSLMVGRPLALVRLGVSLDLRGFAAVNQGWNSFVWDLGKDNRDIGLRDTADFDRVDLPLQLGCRASRNEYSDGLIGYFQETDATPDFGRFYSVYTAPKDGENGICTPENLNLNCRCSTDDTPAKTCLLLVDPKGTLNLSTGILPGRQLTLSSGFYQEALAQMSYTFLATPLLTDTAGGPGTQADPSDPLSDEQGMSIPAPEEPGYCWSWVACQGDTWSQTKVSTDRDRAQWPPARMEILEGWLKLSREIQGDTTLSNEEDDTHA